MGWTGWTAAGAAALDGLDGLEGLDRCWRGWVGRILDGVEREARCCVSTRKFVLLQAQ